MAKTTVVISYARADGSDLANNKRDLVNLALQHSWLDIKDIPDGTEWEPKLMTAIEQADVLIVILTAAATRSEWVQKEVQYALSIQKRTVALKYDPSPPPPWLRSVQFIDNPGQDEAQTFARIMRVLQAVWDEVADKLSDLRDTVDGNFIGLVDNLKTLSDKHAKIRPEGILACAEVLERVTADLNGSMSLTQVVEKMQSDAYLAEELEWDRAYRAHKSVIQQLFANFIKTLSLPKTQFVPVVPIVMTRAEAAELVGAEAFDATSDELRSHFKAVQRTIEQDAGIVDWSKRYGDKSEDWHPFSADGLTLDAILTGELRQRSDEKLLYKPRFVDVRTLNDLANRSELKRLRNGPCVVVMDVMSICHPKLFDAYRRTLLDVFPQTLIIKMAPEASLAISAAEIALRLRQRMDGHFYERFNDKDDLLCVVARREVDLRRELVRIASAASDQGIRATYRDGR